jgi:hypothetical protein
MREAELSVKRLTGILNMEQRRVDESMAVGKDRVQGEVSAFARAHVSNSPTLVTLSWDRRDREWQVAPNRKLNLRDIRIHRRMESQAHVFTRVPQMAQIW